MFLHNIHKSIPYFTESKMQLTYQETKNVRYRNNLFSELFKTHKNIATGKM